MKHVKMDEKYEIERWSKTLLEAQEIKEDPEKMKKVMKHLKDMKRDIRSIEDLKAVAQEKDSDDE